MSAHDRVILPERYVARMEPRIVRVGDCWEWTGCRNAEGYGTYTTPERMGYSGTALVHRLMYEHHVSKIPTGLVIDHLCRNRACCNPEHLEPVTYRENSRRSPLVLKEACPAGHPFVEGSYYNDRGARTCKECKRARVAEFAARSGRDAARWTCEHCGADIGKTYRARHIRNAHPEHYEPRKPSEGLTPERKARRLAQQRDRRRMAAQLAREGAA